MLISAKKDKEKESWVGGAHSLPPKPLHSWASVSETLVSFQPTSNQFQAPMRYVCKKKKKREKREARGFNIYSCSRGLQASVASNTEMTNLTALILFFFFVCGYEEQHFLVLFLFSCVQREASRRRSRDGGDLTWHQHKWSNSQRHVDSLIPKKKRRNTKVQ